MIKGMFGEQLRERFFRALLLAQIEGFGEVWFFRRATLPASHCSSIASSWLKMPLPDVFCGSPAPMHSHMGFYSSAQIVRGRARSTGVEVRGPDINHSEWDFNVGNPVGRAADHLHDLHRRYARTTSVQRMHCASACARSRGITEDDGPLDRHENAARGYDFPSAMVWLAHRPVRRGVLERLADADAFHSFWPQPRREALWAAKAPRPRGG